jgi:BirA family biotin operon repressor/biotin-[acetyl-CoA-carboxylase] ligase
MSDETQHIKIKWPNDIYVNDKKISGILIENTLRDSSIQSAVVGIGININQTRFGSELNATSLTLIANKEFDLMFVMERLCDFIEARYLQLKANKLESIDIAYTQRLYQLDKWCTYQCNNQPFEGKIIGTSALGKLQVQLNTDEIKEFNLKEIEFVRTN